MIVQEIRESQKGNQQATLNLIERFAPLLNKYARKLEPEDGFYDLQLEFLELILHLDCDKVNMQNDGALVNYLSHSIYHSHIKLLKRVITRKTPTISTEELIDQMAFQNALFQEPQTLDFDIPPSLLTSKEQQILYEVYVEGYSAAEIARRVGSTRQNVNQVKRRGEQKLKKYLDQSGQA